MSDTSYDLSLDIRQGMEILNKALQNDYFVKNCIDILASYVDDPVKFLEAPVELSCLEAVAVYDSFKQISLRKAVASIIATTGFSCPPCSNPVKLDITWYPFKVLSEGITDVSN